MVKVVALRRPMGIPDLRILRNNRCRYVRNDRHGETCENVPMLSLEILVLINGFCKSLEPLWAGVAGKR